MTAATSREVTGPRRDLSDRQGVGTPQRERERERERERLFRRFELRAVVGAQDEKLTRTIEAVPASEILSRPPDQLAEELFEELRIEPPVLRESDVHASQEEAKVDVSQDPRRFVFDRSRPFYLSGTRVSFHVPFDGEPFCYERLDHDAEAVRAEFERELAGVRQHLSWVRNDVVPFNESLRTEAKQRIERRREKLLKDQGMVSQLGYPLRQREGAPRTYAVPTARRRPRVRKPARGAKPFVPEPALELEKYENIIAIIDGMVHVMERSPDCLQGHEGGGHAHPLPGPAQRAVRRAGERGDLQRLR